MAKLGWDPICSDRHRWYRRFADVPRGRAQFTYCIREPGHLGPHRDIDNREWERA